MASFTFINGSATISNTEYWLASNSTSKVNQTTKGRLFVMLDCSAMGGVDEFRGRIYDKVNGGTQLPIVEFTLKGPYAQLVEIPVHVVGEAWEVSLLRISNIDRTFGWSLRLENADNASNVNVGSFTAGALNYAALASDAALALGVIRRNTATAGGASTITLDAGASAVDSFYQNTQILIVAGTGVGQCRALASYVGATKVYTVGVAWSTNPDNTSVFILFRDASAAVYQLAAAQSDITAIKAKTDNLPTAPADETLVIAATNTLASAIAAVQADTDDLQMRIPAALDGSGNMKAGVQSLVAGAISSIADAIMNYVIEAAPVNATTYIQRARVMWSLFHAKGSGFAIPAAGVETVRDAADTKPRASYTLNPDGTRTPGAFDGT